MEFILVIPVVFLLIAGAAEVAVMARTNLQVAAAARHGARVAAVVSDSSKAVKAARQVLGEDLGRKARVTVQRPLVAGGSVRVTVVLHHRLLTSLGGIRIPLQHTAVMRVEAVGRQW